MRSVDDNLLAALGSRLSDGRARTIDALAKQLGIAAAQISELLAELAGHGLELKHDEPGAVRLAERFLPLDAVLLKEHLARLRVDALAGVRWSIDSTNTALLRQARAAQLPEDRLTVLAAEFQSRGRGRQGNSWHGAPGVSLCVSLAQCLPRSVSDLSGLSLVCGVAVCVVLQRLGLAPALKWPNDLLVGGQKLGGILVEVHPVSELSSFAVIGIGVNVRPDAMRDALVRERVGALATTDLESAGARVPIDRNELIAEIADALAERLGRFARHGFAPFRDDWNQLDAYRDCEVTLLDRDDVGERGRARGVDDQGRLRLETADGARSIVAGDLSLRAAA